MDAIVSGLAQAVRFDSLLWLSLGEILGIVLGALPGLTATMGLALMLPISFQLPQVPGLALLLGVHCGAVCGASIPAILLGIPGNPNAIATVFDGLAMTKKGMAGQALGGAVIASFIGGTGSLVILVLAAPLVARFTLLFGPAEKATLALVGLTIIASISSKRLAKGLIAGTLGLALALMGTDPFTDALRIPFPRLLATTPLAGGIKLIPALIGLFGISQAFSDLEGILRGNIRPPAVKIEKVFPSLRKIASMWRIILESTGIGVWIGALPGTGASIAVFLSYERARKITASPRSRLEKVGTGCLEGVFAPEVANNAVIGGAFIPTLALGIPGDTGTAVFLGALLIKGIVPGHQLFSQDLALVYGIFFSYFLANVFMVVYQLAGVRLYPKVLSMPMSVLIPVVIILSLVGACAIEGQAVLAAVTNMAVALAFGLIGYALKKEDYPFTPIVLGLILGGMFEENFRRAVKLAGGDYSVFFTKPISLLFIVLAALSVAWPLLGARRKSGEPG
jgi:putative tricarboxylic transport membrane protein